MKIQHGTGKYLVRKFLNTAATALALAVVGKLLPCRLARIADPTLARVRSRCLPRTGGRSLQSVSYRLTSLAAANSEDDNDWDRDHRASIVGLWKFTFVAEGNSGNPAPFNPPDGATLDAGYVQWHSDGTEIMNSGRDPATGSFCLGVWKTTGPSSTN